MEKQTKIPKEIIYAMQKREPFRKIAAQDTSRPKYHFASPANLLIDSWGGIYHDGYYHLFYGNNYDGNPMRMAGLFGHIRSKNLVDWEELPFPLLLREEEQQLNDGVVMIAPSGQPIMYYTRVYKHDMKECEIHRTHVACRGSEDLVIWERMNNGKPFLTKDNVGGLDIDYGWSDVFLFQEQGRTFLIVSKVRLENGCEPIPIYEATDDTWLNWEYRGLLTDHSGELVNFVKIRDKWVLMYSPYQNPRYFIGKFDIDTYKFIPETSGLLSYGYIRQGNHTTQCSRGFYGTTVFSDDKGVVYVSGWLSGFENAKGWDGCISLTRVLDIEDGVLVMKPAPQLDELRKERMEERNGEFICGRCFELNFLTKLKDDETVEIIVNDSFTLTVGNKKVCFNDIQAEYEFKNGISFRLYADVSVAEIFFDGGKLNLSRCFPEMKENAILRINCPSAYTSEAYKLGAEIVLYDTGEIKE